jgi:predicted 3-demethylubiquinone-9 3-methyltransferase (glyoxalase superfamily)
MQKITRHLWFDKQAREAAELYISLFPGSKITNVTTLSGTPSGDCDVVSFQLAGQPFMAISAEPLFKFNPSVSFHIKCGTKEEVDGIWEQLSPGGKVLMPLDTYPFSARYGWLEDRYGLSWQVIHAGGSSVCQKLIPVLMFVGNVCGKAEEAINFYVSVFKNAPDGARTREMKVDVLARYSKGEEPDKEGTVRGTRISRFSAMSSALWILLAITNSRSTKRYRSSCLATRRKRSIISGGSSRRIQKPNSVAGSRTNTAYPGRSLPPSCRNS